MHYSALSADDKEELLRRKKAMENLIKPATKSKKEEKENVETQKKKEDKGEQNAEKQKKKEEKKKKKAEKQKKKEEKEKEKAEKQKKKEEKEKDPEIQKKKEEKEKEKAEKQKKKEEKELEKEKRKNEKDALSERDDLYLQKIFQHVNTQPDETNDDEIEVIADEPAFHTPSKNTAVGNANGGFDVDVVHDAVQLLSVSRPKIGGKQPRKQHHPLQAPHKQPRKVQECQRCIELKEKVESLKRQLVEQVNSQSKL